MPTDGIVRVSWQRRRGAPAADYQAARTAGHQALVGVPGAPAGNGPFTKINSAVYICADANDDAVQLALRKLMRATRTHVAVLDFLSVTITRRPLVLRLRKARRR